MLAHTMDPDAVVSRAFGYPALRLPQRRAVDAVLAGRDVLVVMPTGGGKSLCFQVPALMQPSVTLVLSPLVSLMQDQVDALARRGIDAAAVHGAQSASEQATALAAVAARRVRLVYAAPERFVVGRTIDLLRRVGVGLLAVDEAHCISEWGGQFRPAYRQIGAIRRALGNPPTIALTATATPRVRADIEAECALTRPVRIVAGFDRPNLWYGVCRVRSREARERHLVRLVAAAPASTVVYAQTRARTVRLSRLLVSRGIGAVSYHAGQPAASRRETQARFMDGAVRAIVATSAFGMGVDKHDVRLVVHDAMSPSLESYYQEAGRAGRDGKPARCVLLHADGDERIPAHFAASAVPPLDAIRRVYEIACELGAAGAGVSAHLVPQQLAQAVRMERSVVAGAINVLIRARAMVDDPGARSDVWIRLLATPARLTAELPPAGAHRHLLRAVWHVTRGAIAHGAVVGVADLPPGLGGVAFERALDDMQARQLLVWRPQGQGLRLTDPARPFSALGLDAASLEHERSVGRERLRAMIAYARSASCRRAALLRYFGDDSARRSCGACDVCEGRELRDPLS